jgi:hypothetical protein
MMVQTMGENLEKSQDFLGVFQPLEELLLALPVITQWGEPAIILMH